MRISVLLILFAAFQLHSQYILIDNEYTDWQNIISYDDSSDNPSSSLVGLNSLQVHNSNEQIFVRFTTNKDVLLQENHRITLYLDLDNNVNTGQNKGDMGADIVYNFGDREGYLYFNNFEYYIRHDDIGLIVAPSVTSREFELSLSKSINIYNNIVSYANTVKIIIEDARLNGDRIPNNNSLKYEMKPAIADFKYRANFKKDASAFRIVSLNSRRDDLFNSGTTASQKRILQSLNADIYAIQEIYDNSAEDVKNLFEEILPNTNGERWQVVKLNPDIILATTYDITGTKNIDGNGIFHIEKQGRSICVINVHLPCCDNNINRQDEVDNILSEIKKIKGGTHPIKFPPNTPIIICGDMNFVGLSQQPLSLLTGDIVNEGQYGDDFNPDWDNTSMVDAKPIVTGSNAVYTWFSPGNSYLPGRLDYLYFTDSQLKLKNSFVLKSELLSQDELLDLNLDSEDSSIGTDHLPVVCDFIWKDETAVINESGGFYILPNPVDNVIYLHGLEMVKYKIYSISGVLMMKGQLDMDESIDVSSLSNGYYILNVQTGRGNQKQLSFVKN
jgi:exonuclease III